MSRQAQDPITAGQAAGQQAAAAAELAAAKAANAAKLAQEAAARVPAPVTGLEKLSYSQLRARLEVLRDQRSDLASRRTNLAANYEGSTGANREGMGARLQILDNNIVQFEAQIAAVGQEMAAKAPRAQFTSESNNQGGGYNDDDIAGAVFGTFLGTALLTVLIMKRYVRRKWGRANPSSSQPNVLQANERLDRIEQAVDTIAVEIERVSENQRFMTRLMTETQLGATINEVRKSTELARSAAAESAG